MNLLKTFIQIIKTKEVKTYKGAITKKEILNNIVKIQAINQGGHLRLT